MPHRNQDPEYSPRNVEAVATLAGKYADLYIREFFVEPLARTMRIAPDRNAIRTLLESPFGALAAFYSHYAFARRGKERDVIATAALSALNECAAVVGEQGLIGSDDSVQVWAAFESILTAQGRKPREEQNRGPVQGMLELAQEIHRLYPGLSLATWVVRGVSEASTLEPAYQRIVDIRGIGPKSAATFVRDVVVLFGLEDSVDYADRIYLLSVDRWLRRVLPKITDEPGLDNAPDWIVAGKVAKYTRMANVSACRFDMGVTYFGQRVVVNEGRFDAEFERLSRAAGEDRARLV